MGKEPDERAIVSGSLAAAEAMRLRSERRVKECGRDVLAESSAVDPAPRGIARARAAAAQAEAIVGSRPATGPNDPEIKEIVMGAARLAWAVDEIFDEPS